MAWTTARGLLGPPPLPRVAGAAGDLQPGALDGGVPRIGRSEPRGRVDQAAPAAAGDQMPLLRRAAVAGPQVDRSPAPGAAALDVQALPMNPHGAVGFGGPLLGGAAVA